MASLTMWPGHFLFFFCKKRCNGPRKSEVAQDAVLDGLCSLQPLCTSSEVVSRCRFKWCLLFCVEKRGVEQMSRPNGRGGRAGAFAALLRDVNDLRDCVMRLSKEEQLGDVAAVVERAQRAVATARECLDEVPRVEVAVARNGKRP